MCVWLEGAGGVPPADERSDSPAAPPAPPPPVCAHDKARVLRLAPVLQVLEVGQEGRVLQHPRLCQPCSSEEGVRSGAGRARELAPPERCPCVHAQLRYAGLARHCKNSSSSSNRWASVHPVSASPACRAGAAASLRRRRRRWAAASPRSPHALPAPCPITWWARALLQLRGQACHQSITRALTRAPLPPPCCCCWCWGAAAWCRFARSPRREALEQPAVFGRSPSPLHHAAPLPLAASCSAHPCEQHQGPAGAHPLGNRVGGDSCARGGPAVLQRTLLDTSSSSGTSP